MDVSTLKKTPLHATHEALGARMMAFGGFDMPVQYTSIIDEHNAVRERAGLFDVSHMGEVLVQGPRALDFVQNLVTNDAARLYDGKAMYAVMCQEDGGAVDDLLVYRMDEERYLLVINASNIEKDLAWMRDHNPMGAELEDVSEKTALLAIQGPAAPAIVQKLTDLDLGDVKYYHFAETPPGAFVGCERAILSRTGYTGEPGFEIYCEAEKATDVWAALMDAGQADGLQAAGLGARDTLRLEAGYCLYGNDLTKETNPLEAGLGWTVKLDADDFVGKSALERVKAEGLQRKLVGLVMEARGIPRPGYEILAEGEAVGVVTSGTQSPVLNKGIALGYVPNEAAYTEPGRPLEVSLRGRPAPATVQKPPFHKS